MEKCEAYWAIYTEKAAVSPFTCTCWTDCWLVQYGASGSCVTSCVDTQYRESTISNHKQPSALAVHLVIWRSTCAVKHYLSTSTHLAHTPSCFGLSFVYFKMTFVSWCRVLTRFLPLHWKLTDCEWAVEENNKHILFSYSPQCAWKTRTLYWILVQVSRFEKLLWFDNPLCHTDYTPIVYNVAYIHS